MVTNVAGSLYCEETNSAIVAHRGHSGLAVLSPKVDILYLFLESHFAFGTESDFVEHHCTNYSLMNTNALQEAGLNNMSAVWLYFSLDKPISKTVTGSGCKAGVWKGPIEHQQPY